ncbi:MAG: hypothetical protein ONB17_00985 [candidate division KSB1 bacterium]|nr:hypothetical protein [candidate division KSB1 bacterium]
MNQTYELQPVFESAKAEVVTYDLALALDWEYDWDFVRLIERHAKALGLSTFVVWKNNLAATVELVRAGRMRIRFLIDRASDAAHEFYPLQLLVAEQGGEVLEPLEKLRWASDKATMHLEFIANGLHTPFTIILPPFDSTEEVRLSVAELAHLGRPFVVKPANTTGGGIGVVEGAETLQDVLEARQEHRYDKYLLQQKVVPLERDGHQFWFRGYFACGLTECAWWNDRTHLYQVLTPDEVERYQLAQLFAIVEKIAAICRLRFFSTEIALDRQGVFVVIDYVNELCDMRLQSRYADGVPDEIVDRIASRLAAYVREFLDGSSRAQATSAGPARKDDLHSGGGLETEG